MSKHDKKGGRDAHEAASDKELEKQKSENECSGEGDSTPADEGSTTETLDENAKDLIQAEKSKYAYLLAEFDNYRRRVSKEKLELIDTASAGVINDLLPVVDNFERAIKSLEDTGANDAVKMGTELIHKQLLDVIKKRGVTEIDAVGKDLDTDEHEAVSQIPAPEDSMKGKVVEVIQKGYKLNGKVIRFAKVVVGI